VTMLIVSIQFNL